MQIMFGILSLSVLWTFSLGVYLQRQITLAGQRNCPLSFSECIQQLFWAEIPQTQTATGSRRAMILLYIFYLQQCNAIHINVRSM